MEKVKIILNINNIENEINELKLDIFNDNASQHKLYKKEGYTILEFTDKEDEEKIMSGKHILYGREIEGKIYFARMQEIIPFMDGEIDFYDEFFCKGKELTFG